MKLKMVQAAYVVNDIDAAMQQMRRDFGLGPFVGGGEIELGSHIYRGMPHDPVRFRVAFVQSGDVMIELVERITHGPDAFCDMFPEGATGLHHAASFCDDYESAKNGLVMQGYAVASEFTTPWGATICYIDARPALGHMIELYPRDKGLLDLYAKTRAASDNWDGVTLIVPWLDE